MPLPINDLDSLKRAYRGLDLEICDDQHAIDVQTKARMKRVHRMSLSPSPTDLAWAAQWQYDVCELRGRRPQLLEIAYASFRGVLKTHIDAMIEQGNVVLTADLAGRLIALGQEHCYLREDLARQWFGRFCQEEGIQESIVG